MPALQKNQLLDCLCTDVFDRLAPYLDLVNLHRGTALYEAGEPMCHVYFPVECIVSLLYILDNGESAEISMVGNEGMVGISSFMSGGVSSNRALVRSAGTAYRLAVQRVQDEFVRHGQFMLVTLRYTQSLITQMAQTAACNRHHSIEQQLCRWLLLSMDGLNSDRIAVTQELIANLLGVRREAVTAAAGKLQKLHVIKYSRGQIAILDRSRLEHLSCECYAVVESECDRLLSIDRHALTTTGPR